jgi:hypothetical protein
LRRLPVPVVAPDVLDLVLHIGCGLLEAALELVEFAYSVQTLTACRTVDFTSP